MRFGPADHVAGARSLVPPETGKQSRPPPAAAGASPSCGQTPWLSVTCPCLWGPTSSTPLGKGRPFSARLVAEGQAALVKPLLEGLQPADYPAARLRGQYSAARCGRSTGVFSSRTSAEIGLTDLANGGLRPGRPLADPFVQSRRWQEWRAARGHRQGAMPTGLGDASSRSRISRAVGKGRSSTVMHSSSSWAPAVGCK